MVERRVVELFGLNTRSPQEWSEVVSRQDCLFSGKPCFKIRKSDSGIAIGTCTVRYGKEQLPLIICPNRLLEGGQVFADCMHLLARHQPGHELHLVPEVSIPGGSVDYFLVSALRGKPVDFVGIEFQTMDTTGTVWPARQLFLQSVGVDAPLGAGDAAKTYGVNWKMTAKTILMQLHHKVETFESIGRNLVLVVQQPFLEYMQREFNFGHLSNPAVAADSTHIHSYSASDAGQLIKLALEERFSTDSAGIASALDLGTGARVEEQAIFDAVEEKMSDKTRWSPV